MPLLCLLSFSLKNASVAIDHWIMSPFLHMLKVRAMNQRKQSRLDMFYLKITARLQKKTLCAVTRHINKPEMNQLSQKIHVCGSRRNISAAPVRPYSLVTVHVYSLSVGFQIDSVYVWIKYAHFTHLGRGYLDVDDNGGEGSLSQLWRVVDGVGVQNHQL